MRFARLSLPLAACVLTSLVLPVAQAASPPPGTGPSERVLLTLTPRDRAALHALAHGKGRAHAPAIAALHQALPSGAQRRSVAATLGSLGLTVDRIGTMSVLAHGPASVVDAAFGSARAVDPQSPTQQPLPRLPAALQGQVTVAFGGDDNRPAFRHFALRDGTADGTDLRTAYGDTVTDPRHGGVPTAAEKAQTIATVQLSSWHPSDLTAYAAMLSRQTGVTWPAPRYTGINDPLLPAKLTTNPSNPNYGNDVEVALDQEALYSVAPYARQRAYLSGNDLLGMYDSLSTIGDDATDPTTDRHIVAASISWGFCETDIATDPAADSLYAAFEDILSYDLASGVTVFAASGDNGARCDGKHLGVMYPASSPQVVSVGGAQSAAGTAADPSSYTAWSDDTGSSGGGVSRVFPQPAYQTGVASSAQCPVQSVAAQCRVVPDIAGLAGNPGFRVVSSGPTGGGIIGGTSLASPVLAAAFANEVAEHGYRWGVGDILPGLYAQPTAFTDIAPAGFDAMTGLGSPHWSTLVSPTLGGSPHLSVATAYSRTLTVPVAVHVPDWQTYDSYRITVDGDHKCRLDSTDTTTAPTSVRIPDLGYHGSADGIHQLTLVAIKSAPAQSGFVCRYSDAFVLIDTTKPTPHPKLSVGTGRRDVVASWSGGDAGGSGIIRYAVALREGSRTVFSTTSSRPGSHAVPSRRGRVYTLLVTATDRAGNIRTSAAQLVDDRQFTLSSGWHRQSTTAAFDDSHALTNRSGATARVRAVGRGYRLYVETGPTGGRLAVYVDGHRRATLDTYAKHHHHRVGRTVWTGHSTRARTVVVKALASTNKASNGHDVVVDALGTIG
ncbi:MAG TPA: S8 family serine peptidase [Mycobacteriales bacterium]|nr:S8 family serine peptidase [Mycobacteriales bacterium]